MIGDLFGRAAGWVDAHPRVRRAAVDMAALALVLMAFGPYVAVAFALFRCAQWAARFTAIREPAKGPD